MNNASSYESNEPRGKKKRAKWPFVLLALLAIVTAGYAVYMNAVVGWQTTEVTVESVTVTEDSIRLTGEINGFAGLKDYDYTVDEDTVEVMLHCTWPVFGRESVFDITLEGEFTGVLEVDISDGRNQLVVWGEE